MYKTVRVFQDVDGNVYNIGDEYTNTDTKRLEVLSTTNNKYGVPFIEKIKTRKPRKKVGEE